MAKARTPKKPASSAGAGCCHLAPASAPHDHAHPDHSAELKRLNRIAGQIAGIAKMIEARRYCPDILVQTRAAVAAIKALEDSILESHLRHCVKDAFAAKSMAEGEAKLEELMELFRKRL